MRLTLQNTVLNLFSSGAAHKLRIPFMNEPKTSVIEMTFEEIFDGATDTTFFQEVAESILVDESKESADSFISQRDQDWSLLASQVVGHEHF
jgi:hypothetical protein